MSTFVIADIHGHYDMFKELLDQIRLKETDTLYVLGDILDRGPYPIKTLMKLMEMPNAICLVGNHELMALECLKFLMKEISDMSIGELDEKMLDNLVTWQYNGAKSTILEFRKLDTQEKQDVIDFLEDLLINEEVMVGDQIFLLVHTLGNFDPAKEIEEYSLRDLVWERTDYTQRYFADKYLITGHTPTQVIEGNPNPGCVYKENGHIAIDCGASIPGGRLAAICLETGEEYYSSPSGME